MECLSHSDLNRQPADDLPTITIDDDAVRALIPWCEDLFHLRAPVRARVFGLDIVPPIDLEQASKFLKTLAPDTDEHCWQAYHDVGRGEWKEPRLSRTFYGTLADVHPILTDLNQKGAAICVLVNEGDGVGRGKNNIVRLRAVGADFDNGWPEDLPLNPTAANESSPGKYQPFWMLAEGEELTPEEGRGIVRRLIVDYGADKGCQGINRVLRLPGAFHQKREPFRVRPVPAAGRRYIREELLRAFPPISDEEWAAMHAPMKEGKDQGKSEAKAKGSEQKEETAPAFVPSPALAGFDAGRQRRIVRAGTDHAVYFLDADCGKGKTSALIEFLALVRGIDPRPKIELVMKSRLGVPAWMPKTAPIIPHDTTSDCLVVATKELIQLAKNQALANGIPEGLILTIDSDSHPRVVVKSILKALREHGDSRMILICCQASFFIQPYVHRKGWRVWVDELPQVIETKVLRPHPELVERLNHWLMVEDGKYGPRLIVRPPQRRRSGQVSLRTFLQGEEAKKDEIKPIVDILRRVPLPFYVAYVDGDAWQRVFVDRIVDKDDSKNEVSMAFVMDTHALTDLTFLADDFCASPAHELLEKDGIKVRASRDILLRDKKLAKREGTKVYFAIRRNHSKYFMKELRPDFLPKFAQRTLALLDELGEQTFLLHSNVKYDGALKTDPRAIPLPAKPHGLNQRRFMECTAVVCIGAFNHTPWHNNFMTMNLGLSEGAKRFDHHQMTFQAIMRGNMRLAESSKPVTIVVVDEDTARYVARRLGLDEDAIVKLDGFEDFEPQKKTRRTMSEDEIREKEAELKKKDAARNREKRAAKRATKVKEEPTPPKMRKQKQCARDEAEAWAAALAQQIAVAEARKAAAIAKVRKQHHGKTTASRRIPTYWAACYLAAVGLSADEIHRELLHVFGRDENEKRHIEHALEDLRKKGKLTA